LGEQTIVRLYNTLTRTKEVFTPIDPLNVRMYVCGPTVYDYAHIGNARPVIVFDLLFRLLRHLYPGPGAASDGSRVTYVRNITDVDDKINARALRDFPDLPLNEAIRKVTETTARQYFKDVKALGTLEPTHNPRATEFVLPRPDGKQDMASLIQKLLDENHAYVAKGNEGREVLFRVGSMQDYGQLSGRNLADNLAGARIAVDAHKENPADFVLWKESAPNEPGWAASFSEAGARTEIRGRPGWHIECSAMSEAYLGQVFDIHGGGLDLIFPHHENEIAQSRCAHGTHAMANVWMHNGFLQVEGQKMSKSLGNFITINELLETDKFGGRKWPGEVLRLAMLMTHYREPIDFSVKRLEEAFSRSVELFVAAWDAPAGGSPDSETLDFLSDDLNTPAAVARLVKLARENAPSLATTMALLGLRLDDSSFRNFLILKRRIGEDGESVAEAQSKILSSLGTTGAAVNDAIAARLAALNARDFATADQIRNDLLAQGIQLMDYKDEAGQRQTKWEVKR
jgi:cysteinyl-tRNA synthetase